MTEPVYKWEPATDVYKEKAIQSADVDAELKQRLEELSIPKLRAPAAKEDKAPLGVRIFTWYYFVRAGVCAIVLFILFGYPQSSTSVWLSDNIAEFLRLPGSKSDREARQKEIEKMAQEYAVPENAIYDPESKLNPERLQNLVTAYLFFTLGVSTVVGFMWLSRFWRVRWATMFYSGALIAKVLINLTAHAAAGARVAIDASRVPVLVVTLVFNGLIFLYLAYGYGVKEWFEPES
jgi:hypothetical protein